MTFASAATTDMNIIIRGIDQASKQFDTVSQSVKKLDTTLKSQFKTFAEYNSLMRAAFRISFAVKAVEGLTGALIELRDKGFGAGFEAIVKAFPIIGPMIVGSGKNIAELIMNENALTEALKKQNQEYDKMTKKLNQRLALEKSVVDEITAYEEYVYKGENEIINKGYEEQEKAFEKMLADREDAVAEYGEYENQMVTDLLKMDKERNAFQRQMALVGKKSYEGTLFDLSELGAAKSDLEVLRNLYEQIDRLGVKQQSQVGRNPAIRREDLTYDPQYRFTLQSREATEQREARVKENELRLKLIQMLEKIMADRGQWIHIENLR